MKIILPIIVFSLTLSHQVQSADKDFSYDCTRKIQASKKMLDSFKLQLSGESAYVLFNKDGRDYKARGILNKNYHGKEGWLNYNDFDGDPIVPEYEVSALVESKMKNGSSGDVVLQGTGEAYINETYTCH